MSRNSKRNSEPVGKRNVSAAGVVQSKSKSTETENPGLLALNGNFENWLAQSLVIPVGGTVTTFESKGRIPWPGYASLGPERCDVNLIGTFNDVFQLKTPDKLVTEAEKTLVRMHLKQFEAWLPSKHIDKRCRNKHYVVSRRAAVAAYLMGYNTLQRMLIPGGVISFSEKKIRCEWLVPAWMLFEEKSTAHE